MAIPTASEGHFDQMLTDFAVGYTDQRADAFIADKIFPVIPVGLISAQYREFPRGYFFRDQVAPLPDNGTPNEVYYRTEKKSYYCEVEALRVRITNMETATWVGPGDPRNNKVRLLASQHLVHRDRVWVNEFMRTGVWGKDLTGSATGSGAGETPFWGGANFDIVDYMSEQVDNQSALGAMTPNTLIIGRAVRRALRRNALVKDAIKYTQVGVASLPLLASLFDVSQVLSPTGVYNRTTGEVIDPDTSRPVLQNDYQRLVGDNDALLVYVGESAGIDTVSGGVQFAWNGLSQVAGNSASGGATPGFAMTPMADQDGATTAVNRGTWDYGEWMDQLCAHSPKLLSPDLGIYYSGVVQ